MGGAGKRFVDCSEHERPEINSDAPPCPLTLELFAIELAERMGRRQE